VTRRAVQRVVLFAVALLVGALMWELYKIVGPEDGGSILGWQILPKSNDRAMPHSWDVVERLGRPESAALDEPIWRTIVGYSWYTFRLALVGLVIGVIIGTAIAVLAARYSIAERAIMPWVVMSQTVPLIALAPQLVSWSGKFDIFGWEWQKWMSVSLLAAFLSFFPIAVGTLRGLKSAPPAALELMDSYAASWWRTLLKLRFPAAVPYIVPAAKLAATLSVVGVIVSEVSTGLRGGIGRAVVSYQQSASGDPTKPYVAVIGAAALGLALYGLVVLIDVVVMRNRPQEAEA
jgi:NitT/TauT family transport system permease protein